MPIYSVALLFGPEYVWGWTSEEQDTIYSLHPRVLKYTHVVAEHGEDAVNLAKEKFAAVRTSDKFVSALGTWANVAPPKERFTESDIMVAIECNNWNWVKTAKQLGISTQTLRRWRIKYKIPNKRVRSVA